MSLELFLSKKSVEKALRSGTASVMFHPEKKSRIGDEKFDTTFAIAHNADVRRQMEKQGYKAVNVGSVEAPAGVKSDAEKAAEKAEQEAADRMKQAELKKEADAAEKAAAEKAATAAKAKTNSQKSNKK